ncbi:methylmalonic aciduria and homocystinuria type D protein [Synechococcales cyanobacterium C]|uniref:Methylmalonic aciduria and homocystinuria type D protein n=1 Tax=Petrachloros mirabilis ULC683 TaxID=2781853 RepID=A0A8K2A9B9_9CYAN|nr:methylmalonic aciduria and homocystinuria type D protein [Petrachloros mirabilis]NCJ08109.1 methylmalonic aciduria and homocystinuria type D protein [Petrachloros mirabilis ULC683]
MGLQYSVHRPSGFILAHGHQLLPEWRLPVQSVLVVLQHCQVPLVPMTPETERQKQSLRLQFLSFARPIVQSLQTQGYEVDLFDPKTGQPLLSLAGILTLDDVAVVQSLLGYPFLPQGQCHVLAHPQWGTAVFPSVLVSTAPPEQLAAVVQTACPSSCSS